MVLAKSNKAKSIFKPEIKNEQHQNNENIKIS